MQRSAHGVSAGGVFVQQCGFILQLQRSMFDALMQCSVCSICPRGQQQRLRRCRSRRCKGRHCRHDRLFKLQCMAVLVAYQDARSAEVQSHGFGLPLVQLHKYMIHAGAALMNA